MRRLILLVLILIWSFPVWSQEPEDLTKPAEMRDVVNFFTRKGISASIEDVDIHFSGELKENPREGFRAHAFQVKLFEFSKPKLATNFVQAAKFAQSQYATEEEKAHFNNELRENDYRTGEFVLRVEDNLEHEKPLFKLFYNHQF